MCHTLISDCHQIINWLLLNERLAKLPKNIVLLWVYSVKSVQHSAQNTEQSQSTKA